MPYEEKTAIAIIQKAIESFLKRDIKNMTIYQNEICLDATNVEELKNITNLLLNRLRISNDY